MTLDSFARGMMWFATALNLWSGWRAWRLGRGLKADIAEARDVIVASRRRDAAVEAWVEDVAKACIEHGFLPPRVPWETPDPVIH